MSGFVVAPEHDCDVYCRVFEEERGRHRWGLPDLPTPVPLRLRSAAKSHKTAGGPAA